MFFLNTNHMHDLGVLYLIIMIVISPIALGICFFSRLFLSFYSIECVFILIQRSPIFPFKNDIMRKWFRWCENCFKFEFITYIQYTMLAIILCSHFAYLQFQYVNQYERWKWNKWKMASKSLLWISRINSHFFSSFDRIFLITFHLFWHSHRNRAMVFHFIKSNSVF